MRFQALLPLLFALPILSSPLPRPPYPIGTSPHETALQAVSAYQSQNLPSDPAFDEEIQSLLNQIQTLEDKNKKDPSLDALIDRLIDRLAERAANSKNGTKKQEKPQKTYCIGISVCDPIKVDKSDHSVNKNEMKNEDEKKDKAPEEKKRPEQKPKEEYRPGYIPKGYYGPRPIGHNARPQYQQQSDRPNVRPGFLPDGRLPGGYGGWGANGRGDNGYPRFGEDDGYSNRHHGYGHGKQQQHDDNYNGGYRYDHSGDRGHHQGGEYCNANDNGRHQGQRYDHHNNNNGYREESSCGQQRDAGDYNNRPFHVWQESKGRHHRSHEGGFVNVEESFGGEIFASS